jgi:hypothetical protein
MVERRARPIHKKDVDALAKQKQETSPWMSSRTARRIARDEIRAHPSTVAMMPLTQHLIKVEDRTMQRPKKRKPKPRPQASDPYAMMRFVPKIRYPGQ